MSVSDSTLVVSLLLPIKLLKNLLSIGSQYEDMNPIPTTLLANDLALLVHQGWVLLVLVRENSYVSLC